MSELSYAEVGEILHLLQGIDGADVELEWGDLRITVSRGGPFRPAEAPAPAEASGQEVPSAVPQQGPRPGGAATERAAPAEPEPAQPAGTDAGAPDVPGHWRAVTAPMAGTFYRSPGPEEDPFVEVGDTVAAGDTVALVEVMKLFTELRSESAGKVARIDVTDGQLVEFGEPLVWVEPA